MVSASHGPRGPGVRRSIAVIIPVRNAAATLEQSLGTLQRQTFPDFRVVLVDDGSTDETPQLLERLTQADRRFDLLRLSPGGDIARALEAGTAHLEEPLLARFDADDLAHPERFARQVDFLTRHPEIGLVATGVERFTTDAEGEALLRGELISPATTDGWRRYADWLDTTPPTAPEVPMVTMTVGYVMDRYGWLDVCDLVGLSEWAVNEGQIGREYVIGLPASDAARLGLLG